MRKLKFVLLSYHLFFSENKKLLAGLMVYKHFEEVFGYTAKLVSAIILKL